MINAKALAVMLSGVAVATTTCLAGCVVTPEPIPLLDGMPWSPSNDMDKGGFDTRPTGLDAGLGLDAEHWTPPDASAAPDAVPDALGDGLSDALEDSAPGEGGPGEGGPGEGGPTSDTASPAQDGSTGDAVSGE